MRRTSLLLMMLFACGPDDAPWTELDESELASDPGKEDEDKPDEASACGDEVVEGESCQGDWTTTTCVDGDGTWWWCDEGMWSADKDA